MGEEKKEPVKQDPSNQDALIKSDAGTTGTTDPQKHMEGPLSSLMQGISNAFKENDKKYGEENK